MKHCEYGSRFGHNAKMSKRSTTVTTPRPTTTVSPFELPLFATTTTATTNLVDATYDVVETARTLSRNLYPTTATTLTTVSQPILGGNSFQVSPVASSTTGRSNRSNLITFLA
jgi:hypothetical protein